MNQGAPLGAESSDELLGSISRRAEVPLVSVVVVNYNGLNIIERCLDSVLASEYPCLELIVVDNSSTDGSLQRIVLRYGADQRLTFAANRRNLGFAEGCNVGARRANGQYLFFLNSDTDIKRDAIGKLVDALKDSCSVAVAQSKLLTMDKKRLDGTGDTVCRIGWPYPRGKFEIDHGQYDSQKDIFGARGAAMIIRKVIFDEVRGFDPDYFMYYEDLDLSWRIRLRGYTIVFVPESVVYHLAGGLFTSAGPRAVANNLYSGRNYMATLVKNLELRNLLVYGSAHVVVHLSTIVFYLSQRRVHEALGLILALAMVIVDFPMMWRKRQVVQRFRVVSDKEIFKDIRKIPTMDYLRSHFTRVMLTRPAAGLRARS